MSKTTTAIIQIAGKQFSVQAGDSLILDRQKIEPGKTLEVTDVLMTIDGDKTKVGTPLIKGASVTLKAVDHVRGKKIEVRTYKSKSRYRRHIGHRQDQTSFEVVKVSA